MDNNNSIPYGTISWDNEEGFSAARQQRELQMIHPPRNFNSGNRNGLRHSLRGPHAPRPPLPNQESVVGFLRNSTLLLNLSSNRPDQSPATVSRVQQRVNPISSTSSTNQASNFQSERFFSLRPSSPSPLNIPTSQGQIFRLPSDSVNQEFALLPRNPTVPARSHDDVESVPVVNSNGGLSLQTIQSETRRNPEGSQTSRVKRKSSQVTENDNVTEGSSCKHFLSEEKMAARMHNLRISNDHSYVANNSPLSIDWSNQLVEISRQQGQINSGGNDCKEKSEERKEDQPVFVLNPHMKNVLGKDDSILPEAILNQLSKPCLAVVPWKGPNENLPVLTVGSKNSQDSKENSSKSNNIVKESAPTNEQSLVKRIHHVEIIGQCDTFTLDDEDMEL